MVSNEMETTIFIESQTISKVQYFDNTHYNGLSCIWYRSLILRNLKHQLSALLTVMCVKYSHGNFFFSIKDTHRNHKETQKVVFAVEQFPTQMLFVVRSIQYITLNRLRFPLKSIINIVFDSNSIKGKHSKCLIW